MHLRGNACINGLDALAVTYILFHRPRTPCCKKQLIYINFLTRAHQREKSPLSESHLNSNRSVGRRYLEDRRFFAIVFPRFRFKGIPNT